MMRWSIALVLALAPSGALASFDIPGGCEDDLDCAPYADAPWCDPRGFCSACTGDADCTAPDEVCRAGACVLPCTGDVDCTAAEPTCHPEQGHCVVCTDDAGCLASEHCSVGACVPDGCAQGELRCAYSVAAVLRCNAAGSGWDTVEACDEGCTIVDDVPQCTSSGTSSGDGTSGSTSTTGVDGNGDETADPDDGSTGAPVPGGSENGSGTAATGCSCGVAPQPVDLAWLTLVLACRRRAPARRFSARGSIAPRR